MTKIVKDTFYFIIGTFVPALVSFISVPIMTRYFLPEEYGQNAIIDTSFSYVSIVIFGFISSLVWRFYNEYKNDNRIEEFWGCIFFLIKISWIIVISGCFLIIAFPIDLYLKKMIFIKGISLLISSYISIMIIIIRLEGNAFLFNIIQCYNSIFSFLVLLILTKVFHMRNVSMYLNGLIVSIPVFIFLLIKNRNIKVGYINRNEMIVKLKPFFIYGGVALLSTFLQVVLDSSDRYMIKYFYDYNLTGIYDKLYSISNKILDIFVALFMNLFSPYIYKALSDKSYKAFFRQLMPFFCGVFFPLLFYYSVFSKTICEVLLAESYLQYYYLIPIISIGYVLIQFSSFAELVIKFSEKFYLVTIGFSLSLFTNFLLNFLLIPRIGVVGAAIGTAGAYLVLLIFFFIKGKLLSFKYVFFNKKSQNLFYIIPIFECSIYIFFQIKGISFSVFSRVMLAICFAISYYLPFGFYFFVKNKDFIQLFEKEEN